MRRLFAIVGFGCALAAAASVLAIVPAERTEAAPKVSTFIVPAADGYGVGDCMSSGSSCGQVVADAWCEAQGFKVAAEFGLADPADVTGTIQVAVKSTQRPISITCK